jgi:hypothetical protein
MSHYRRRPASQIGYTGDILRALQAAAGDWMGEPNADLALPRNQTTAAFCALSRTALEDTLTLGCWLAT